MNYMIIPGLKNKKEMPVTLKKTQTEVVLGICETYFNVSFQQMSEKNRVRSIRYPRQVTMCMLRYHTMLSLKQIGKMFNQDHTTVIHTLRTISDLVFSDKQVELDIFELNSYF